MDPSDSSDVDQLLFVVQRVDAGLRLLARQPSQYVPNGHFHRLANLLTCVQAEVTDWLDAHADPLRGRPRTVRQRDRRRTGDRRHVSDPETTA